MVHHSLLVVVRSERQSVVCEWRSMSLDSPRKDFVRIRPQNKDSRRESSERKAVGERVGAPRLFWDWILLGSSGLGGAVTTVGCSLTVEAVSNHLGGLLPQVGGGGGF